MEYDFTDDSRFYAALSDQNKIISCNVSAIMSSSSSGNQTYHVTLNACDCKDFQISHRVCKHMYRLALEFGLPAVFQEQQLDKALDEITSGYLYLERMKKEQQASLEKLQSTEKAIIDLNKKKRQYENDISLMLQNASLNYPWLAAQIADLPKYEEKRIAYELRTKNHPALKAAKEIERLSKEKRDAVKYAKILEYRLSVYSSALPWLSDLDECSPSELYSYLQSTSENPEDDNSIFHHYISPEEYNELSTSEKYQIALDRWRVRPRSNWQAGIDFERFVGYKYESAGFKVEYSGALNGKLDFGRDLIVSDGGIVTIIQCKRWSATKTIHEKHIFQLYGSMVAYHIEHPDRTVFCKMITTCPLSDTAKGFAKYLNVEVEENYPCDELHSYPIIKCNISKDGDKIYHLPFDQQYDRVQIAINAGERYVATVAEAESLGFHRAKRWQGNKNDSST